MKKISSLLGLLLYTSAAFAQDQPHYTMFMYNKLIYNPAYAGNKNITSVNASYRSQWTGLEGAPKNFSVALDAPIGSYMKPFRRVALGLSVNNESLGVTDNTNLMAYYAYRVPFSKSVLSFGLQAGGALYSANYNKLNPSQGADNALGTNVNNSFLPNVGAGVFWSGDRYYVSASVPNLLENYYDKNTNALTNSKAKQLRSYYLSGGYVFRISDAFKIYPQTMVRYAGNENYQLPLNVDANLSLIFLDRLLIGATYRSDNTIDAIIHLQATKWINVGYAFGYSTSQLSNFNNGTHEIVVGLDFIRDLNKYVNPRFIKPF